MDLSYVPKWGVSEVLREVHQNFLDYGAFEWDIDDHCTKFSNTFQPKDLSFLRIGHTTKTAKSIGGFGEGLKLALLVCLREDVPISIFVRTDNLTATITPCVEDTMIGDSIFGVDIEYTEGGTGENTYSVEIDLPRDTVETYRSAVVGVEDEVFKSYYGSIVDKPPGSIYVGGLFVCVVDSLQRAYNFCPEHMKLNRDRNIPNQFDLLFNAGVIENDFIGMNPDKVNPTDIQSEVYTHANYPAALCDVFAVDMLDDNIILKAGDTVASAKQAEKLMKSSSELSNRVKTFRYKLRMVESPFDTVTAYFGGEIGSENLIDASKGWRIK